MALGIAFEGCAGRAAFSAGVAMELQRCGQMPDLIAGASSGAIVAVFAAAGRAGELEQSWLTSAGSPVFSPTALLRLAWPFRMSEIVARAMSQAFGGLRLDELPRSVAIPVTFIGVEGRSRRVLTRADAVPVVEAVLASCFVPGPYSRVIRIDGRPAFDGAWQERAPLKEAQDLGASRVIVVNGHPRETLATGYPFVRQVPLPADCRVIRPRLPLALGGYDTDESRIRAAIQAGRRAASRFLERESDWMTQGS